MQFHTWAAQEENWTTAQELRKEISSFNLIENPTGCPRKHNRYNHISIQMYYGYDKGMFFISKSLFTLGLGLIID